MTSIKIKQLETSTEKIFRIPFLMIIKEAGRIKTSDVILQLRSLFEPAGHDAEIISGRADDYFSQKVRNVKSHSSLKNLAEYDRKSGWYLSVDGIDFLTSHAEIVDEIDRVLSNAFFTYFDKISYINAFVEPIFKKTRKSSNDKTKHVSKDTSTKKKIIYYDENIVEGKSIFKTAVVRERSKKLRDAAIQKFTNNGTIKCEICGYEFAKTYGDFGKGYIEIHHKKPICQYSDEDVNNVVSEALDNLVPVCSNCHSMLHHDRTKTYDDVVKIYKDNNEKGD